MPCYSPLHGYKSRTVNPSGKRSLVFDPVKGYHDMPVSVPCGQCIGCRLEKSRQWAVRIMHEASLHEENCFITLTYDDKHLPPLGSLVKGDFQKFMKRLRKANCGQRIRFYHCGEYGDRSGRPHYHSCLFGFDFRDKVHWTDRGGFPVWRSDELERLWPYGLSEIGSVTFESAAYVARYITKKVSGPSEVVESAYRVVARDTGEVEGHLQQEYATMSRRPGIGRDWYDEFGEEVYPDGVLVRGRLMQPPKFYDGLLESEDPEQLKKVKRNREKLRRPEDETPERLAVREEVERARVNLKTRSLD